MDKRHFKVEISKDFSRILDNVVIELATEQKKGKFPLMGDLSPLVPLFRFRMSPIVFFFECDNDADLRMAMQDFDSYDGIVITEVTGTAWRI